MYGNAVIAGQGCDVVIRETLQGDLNLERRDSG